jgi:hypothetical protein
MVKRLLSLFPLLLVLDRAAPAATFPLPPLPPLPVTIIDSPPSAVTPALAAIPPDVQGLRNQLDFDLFAWREFVALNWPADPATCSARRDVTILDGGRGPRVWETWKTDAEVFVDPARGRPGGWCPQPPPLLRPLPGISRFAGDPLPGIQQAFGGPLVDQAGRFVRYEERVNRDEFDHLVVNDLWNRAGQTRWLAHDAIDLPAGSAAGPGAIEVKAAWKVLTPAELQGGRFYAIRARLTTGRDAAGRAVEALADVGLIGLHITHKSRSSPQWTWATFEHVDNLTSSLRRPECRARVACTLAATFFCPDGCCPDDCQTTTCTDGVCPELAASGLPAQLPTQVTRVQDVALMSPPDRDVGRVNEAFRHLLAGTVWANYQLIGNQWPTRPEVAGGVPAPPFLANVALETFNQGHTPEGSDGAAAYPSAGYAPFRASTSSSCLKCHFTAQTAGTDRAGHRAPADFSFLLSKAR